MGAEEWTLKGRLDQLERERDAARAEAERLREALEWYADEENWQLGRGVSVPMPSKVEKDGGARARAALAGEEAR